MAAFSYQSCASRDNTGDIIIVVLIHLHGVIYTNVCHEILQRSVIFLKWVIIGQFIPASPAVEFILFYRQNFILLLSNVGLRIDKSISFWIFILCLLLVLIFARLYNTVYIGFMIGAALMIWSIYFLYGIN